MNDPNSFTGEVGRANRSTTTTMPSLGVGSTDNVQAAYLTLTFVWMVAGLLTSAVVALAVQSNDQLLRFAERNFFLLVLAQLALVFVIELASRRVGVTVGLALFFIYSAALGLTVGLIIAGFELGSAVSAFLSASAVFGAAAIYGSVTKRSLSSVGGILFIGLIGLFAALVLNLVIANGSLSFVISIIGVGLFTALTAYDVQRIQRGDLVVYTGSVERAAVLGAVHLYLDFLNLFLFLLHVQGGGGES